MSLVKVAGLTMSLDGYVAGPDQSQERPMGRGADGLHAWLFATRYFHELHGGDGGESNAEDALIRAAALGVGATIMGRNMFGPIRGPWTEPQWDGWWGEEPPFGHDVFVLTHHAREPLALGATTFHFVTDGIDAALDRAREAAGDEDVAIGGGASTVRQYLRAGVVDSLQIAISAMFLGGGERLFGDLGDVLADYTTTLIHTSDSAAHYRIERAPTP